MQDYRIFTSSKKIIELPFIEALLGKHLFFKNIFLIKIKHYFFAPQKKSYALLGWGHKPSTFHSREHARKHNLSFVAIEDGFIRSYSFGFKFKSLSLVIDYEGIFYDSTKPSTLEELLRSESNFLTKESLASKEIYSTLLLLNISKYNNSAQSTPNFLNSRIERRVLVIDQTFGDMSVELGQANADTFSTMLSAARAENPCATIYIKTHPELTDGQKRGYLTDIKADERTIILRDQINPIILMMRMDHVYVVTSGMGFEALLCNKPVTCFGVPWYSGWGLTDDRCINSPTWARRNKKRSVDELFTAAYIHYTSYLDPKTHTRGTIMDVIHWIIHQKEMATRMHGHSRKGRVIGVGFRRWKAANLKPLLGLHSNLVKFVKNGMQLSALKPTSEDSIVHWGAIPPKNLIEITNKSSAKLLHAEDGFIRSVGLGSDLVPPLSIVLDQKGIYFDATRPSDLEHLLSNHNFTEADIERARSVRCFIVENGITKYNTEILNQTIWPHNNRTIILVPGQVEDDASILLGCTGIRSNLDLLKDVRLRNPAAFIVYKPHPDVVSKNRRGEVPLKYVLEFADYIEKNTSVIKCIEECDEVHTMTSLAGFDALLRGKKVVTYGQPFYAGWGLTDDLATNPTAFIRRKKRLNLDELVAGALLHYPIYWDWELNGYTTCEAVLHRIVEKRIKLEKYGEFSPLTIGYPRRQLRKLIILIRSSFQSV